MSMWIKPAPAVNALKVTVGLVPVPLTSENVISQEVSVLADIDNAGIVYLGAQGIVSATQGFKLTADHGLAGIRVISPHVVWAVGSVAGQVLWVFWTEPEGRQT